MAQGKRVRFVYLVFSHRRPEQVQRLVERILALSPEGDVVLHHDPRTEPMIWSRPPGPRVRFIEPQPMDWGAFSMVSATAKAFEHIDGGPPYDWCAVVSGQDYPVTHLGAWEDQLVAGGSDYLLSAREVSFDPSLPRRVLARDEYYVRYAYRWRPLGRVPARSVPVANGLARLVRADPVALTRPFMGRQRLGTARRTPFVDGWRCYKGSQWMALSHGAVRGVLDVIERRPELARYYATTLVPDESFFQSILRNQTTLRGCDERLSFTLWSGSGAAHPKVLRSTDVGAALASGCPFARKFDIDIDESALDALDRATG